MSMIQISRRFGEAKRVCLYFSIMWMGRRPHRIKPLFYAVKYNNFFILFNYDQPVITRTLIRQHYKTSK